MRFAKLDANHEIHIVVRSQVMMWVMTKPEKQKGQIRHWVKRTESLALELELEDRLKAEKKEHQIIEAAGPKHDMEYLMFILD